MYVSLVRPHSTYDVQAWNPHLQRDIDRIERAQRRTTWIPFGFENIENEGRLKKFSFTTLNDRCMRGMLRCLLYFTIYWAFIAQWFRLDMCCERYQIRSSLIFELSVWKNSGVPPYKYVRALLIFSKWLMRLLSTKQNEFILGQITNSFNDSWIRSDIPSDCTVILSGKPTKRPKSLETSSNSIELDLRLRIWWSFYVS